MRGQESEMDHVGIPSGLFAKDPEIIVDYLASKEASPRGLAYGMRVLCFYLTHTGKVLSPAQRRSLEKARKLLSIRIDQTLKSGVTAAKWK